MDSAHTTQHTERAHLGTGAKWPRTPHTQHKKPRGHIAEQESTACPLPPGSGAE